MVSGPWCHASLAVAVLLLVFAVAIGAGAGLVMAPCSTPVLAGVLTSATTTRGTALGFVYLFALSLGMSALLRGRRVECGGVGSSCSVGRLLPERAVDPLELESAARSSEVVANGGRRAPGGAARNSRHERGSMMVSRGPWTLGSLFSLPSLCPGAAIALSLAGAAATARAQGSTQPLDTLRVTVASRAGDGARGTRSATVITRADIARTAARSLADVIAPALGVDVRARSLASADVALRGASSEGVVILVDGVRVSDQQSGHFDLDLVVPLDAIERIEVLRGTHSALYGADAVGGVINIVTRAAAHAGLSSFAASGGSFGTASLAAAGAGAAAGARLSGAVDVARSDGHRADTDYLVTQARGNAMRALGGGTLRLDAGGGVRHFGAADFYGAYASFEDTRAATASARWEGVLPAGWSLALGADTRRHGDLFTLVRADPALYQNRHVSWQSGGDIVARRTVSDALTIAVGADAGDLRLRSARLGDHDLRRGALFSEVTIGRPGGPTLDAGVRVDRSSVDGTFVSPTVAAAMPLGTKATVRMSGARGYRAPTWTERYYLDPANVGDPGLRVERFWAGEVGARIAPSSRTFVDAAVFVRDARDLIDWAKPLSAGDSTPWRTMNVARARYRGVEGEAGFRGALGGDWAVRASGLAFDARSAAGYRGKYALSPITRSLGVSATYPLNAARAGLDVTVARRAGEETHATVNGRALLPVRMLPGVELTLDLLNLTNASYLDVSGAPIASRAAYVGLRWSAR